MGNTADWLYGIQSGLFIKIGVTRNIANRMREMALYNPHPCKLVARRQTQFAYIIEKEVHRVLAPYAIGREWFACDPALVRATFTLVVKQVVSDQLAWQRESAERAAARLASRGIDVENKNEKIIPLKRNAK